MKGEQPARVSSCWALLLALLMAAFTLACRLVDPAFSDNALHDSMLVKLLGDSRLAVGQALYEEADNVFHRGVPRFQPKDYSLGFTKLQQAIVPSGHVHLHAEGVVEIMPWLNFALRMNPYDVETYSVAAFWLAGEAQRPDLAEQVLMEARRNNPRDHRVYLETGILAMKEGRLPQAAQYLEAALKLWPGSQDPEDEQARLDRAEIMLYRGLLSEQEGDLARAKDMYRQILITFPGRTALQDRLIFLETHGHAPTPPLALWSDMLVKRRGTCSREEHAASLATEN